MAEQRSFKTQSFSLYPRLPSSPHQPSVIVTRKAVAAKPATVPSQATLPIREAQRQPAQKSPAQCRGVSGYAFPPTPPSSVSGRSSVDSNESPDSCKLPGSRIDEVSSSPTHTPTDRCKPNNEVAVAQQPTNQSTHASIDVPRPSTQECTTSIGRVARNHRTGLRKPGTGLKWERLIHLGDQSTCSSISTASSTKPSTELSFIGTGSIPQHAQAIQASWSRKHYTLASSSINVPFVASGVGAHSPVTMRQPNLTTMERRETLDSIDKSEETSFFDDDDEDDTPSNPLTQCFMLRKKCRGTRFTKEVSGQRLAEKNARVKRISGDRPSGRGFGARLKEMLLAGTLVARRDGG